MGKATELWRKKPISNSTSQHFGTSTFSTVNATTNDRRLTGNR